MYNPVMGRVTASDIFGGRVWEGGKLKLRVPVIASGKQANEPFRGTDQLGIPARRAGQHQLIGIK